MTRKRKPTSTKETSTTEAARPYAALVYRGKSLGKKLELRLKKEPRRVIGHLLRHSPVQRIRLTGTPCPATLAELAGSIPSHASDQLVDELNWTAAVLYHHASELNRFIACRDVFEAAILADDYPRAEEAREQSIREVGHSWWAIEADFLLAQRRGGLEANRTLLQRYQADAEPWIGCVCPFYSLRVEEGLPVAEYDKHLDAICAPGGATDKPSELQRYLRFRLNYHRFEGITGLAACMNVEESHSIVDRYITFARAAHLAMTAGRTAEREAAADTVTAVASQMSDHALLVTAGLHQPQLIRRDPRQEVLFQVLHDYTEGRYREAWERALTGLAQYPGCFELIELAARSGARAGCGVVSPFPSGAPGHEILSAVTEVLRRGPDSAGAVRRLNKFAYLLDALPIGAQIYAFVLRQEGGTERATLGPFEFSGAAEATPWLAMGLAEDGHALDYLDRLGELYPGNAACVLFRAVRAAIGGKEFTSPAAVPHTRVLKYRGLVLERMGRPEEALVVYRELDDASADNPLLASDATTGKYRCSLVLGDTLESASILAGAVALNPRLVTGEMVRQVLVRYPVRRGTEWLGHICWPILHCAANREGHRVFAADHLHDVLDDFLTARFVQKPSELRAIADAFDPVCLIYLLRNLCVPDVLDSSPWYNSQEDVEAERIRICEWLAELDPPRRTDYIDEIAELTRRATMRELTHKVGQSKISVDTEGIRARLTPAYTARVRRCLMFAALTSDLRHNIETFGFLKKDDFKKLDVKLIDAN